MYKRSKTYSKKVALKKGAQRAYAYGWRPKKAAIRTMTLPQGWNPPDDLGTFDISSTASMDSASTTAALFYPTRTGNNYIDRTGDRTKIVSFRFKFTIKPGSAQGTNQWVRCLVYFDNQPNNAVPGGNLPLLALTPLANPEPQYTQRFKIFFNRVINVSSAGAASMAATNQDQTGMSRHYEFYKKCNLMSVFTGNAGSIADIQTGSLNLLVLGDTAAGTNEVPVMTYTSRCRFEI